MEAGLQHDHIVTVNQVDEPMFLVDTPRPSPSEGMTKLLRFADPGERIAQDCVKETIDALYR